MNARQIKEMEVEEWMERERYDREPRYPKRNRKPVTTISSGVLLDS